MYSRATVTRSEPSTTVILYFRKCNIYVILFIATLHAQTFWFKIYIDSESLDFSEGQVKKTEQNM